MIDCWMQVKREYCKICETAFRWIYRCFFCSLRKGICRRQYRIIKSAEMPCDKTVARAAPDTPMENTSMNKRSRKIFKAVDNARNARGIVELPIERDKAAKKL